MVCVVSKDLGKQLGLLQNRHSTDPAMSFPHLGKIKLREFQMPDLTSSTWQDEARLVLLSLKSSMIQTDRVSMFEAFCFVGHFCRAV